MTTIMHGVTTDNETKRILVDDTGHLQIDIASTTAVSHDGLNELAGAIDSGELAVSNTGLTSLASAIANESASAPDKVVTIAGRYSSSGRTFDDGDVGALAIDSAGHLQTDVLSITPGTDATHLGKAIQSAQGATDTGVAALVVRNDTLGDLAGGDHQFAPLQVNDSGALYTTLAPGSEFIGKLAANEATNIGTVTLSNTCNTSDVTITGALPSGDNNIGKVEIMGNAAVGGGGADRHLVVNENGALHSILASNSGTDIGDVDVLTCGTITPGFLAANLGKKVGEAAGDSGSGVGDVGVAMMVIRDDALTTLDADIADGDYVGLRVNSVGALHSVLSSNSGVDIGDVDVLTCGTITPGFAAANLGKKVGEAASDGGSGVGDVGVAMMVIRDDTLATLDDDIADGDYVGLRVNSVGALHASLTGVTGVAASQGPDNALSIGGKESDGTFRDIRVDTAGHLQVDIASDTAVTHDGLTSLNNASAAEGGTTSKIVVLGGRFDSTSDPRSALDDGQVGALAINSVGALITATPNISTATFSAQAVPGGATSIIPANGNDGIDARNKTGKITIWGSMAGATGGSGAGSYNNIILMGSTASINTNADFTSLSVLFQLQPDSDGNFAATFDLVMPYIKFQIENSEASGSGDTTVTINYAFN